METVTCRVGVEMRGGETLGGDLPKICIFTGLSS